MVSSGDETKRGGARALWLILIVGLLAAAAVMSWPRSSGPDLVPWRTELASAQAEASRSGRPLLLNFTADWCPPCQEMKATVYSDPAFAQWLGERFVPVKVDLTEADAGEEELSVRYDVIYIPTLIVADAEGNRLSAASGYIPRQELQAALTAVLEQATLPEAADLGDGEGRLGAAR